MSLAPDIESPHNIGRIARVVSVANSTSDTNLKEENMALAIMCSGNQHSLQRLADFLAIHVGKYIDPTSSKSFYLYESSTTLQ